MTSRALLAPSVRRATRTNLRCARYLATPSAKTRSATPSSPPPPPQTWLAKKLKESPRAMQLFLGFSRVLGYSSPKQVAGRRALAMYEQLCAGRAEEDLQFWREDCDLPPTFQSWFTITNLHVWLLTVRLRALPKGEGQDHVQGLIDHFFFDVEDRIRLVLAPSVGPVPPSLPSASTTSSPSSPTLPSSPAPTPFYVSPNGSTSLARPARPAKPAPERLVSQQMKIFREQWAGMGMALDLGLVRGDADLAAAVWRNLLGARGARGLGLGEAQPAEGRPFRRSINLVGGSTAAVRLIDAAPGGLEAAERKDDLSGVHDYAPSEVDKYVRYPALMATLVQYIRRELARLEGVSDVAITGVARGHTPRPGEELRGVQNLRFGRVQAWEA